MNKKTMAALIIGGALALGGVSVYAANQIARSSAITEESAWNFAFVDAGVLPEEANVIKTEFDFEKGRFVYEVEFTANGMKYSYVIDSTNGNILEREAETLPGSGYIKPTQSAESASSNTQQTVEDKLISIDKAKELALAQAGLKASEVTFKKTKAEREQGRQVYSVEFYVAGEMKYDYTIDALTGAILEEALEVWEADDYAEYNVSQGTNAQAGTAGTGSGQSGSAGTGGSQSGNAGSAGQSETTGSAGQSGGTSGSGGGSAGAGGGSSAQPTPAPSQPVATPAPTAAPTPAPAPVVQDIGVERAKSIALSHAGVSASSVSYWEKIQQDREDGVLVYDIDFRVGNTEYDYEIDAATGAIREYDIDVDD